MSPLLIIVIVVIVVMGLGFCLAGGVCGLLMMEEVDRRNPDLNLYSAFSSFSRRFDRGQEIQRQYRSLSPNGKLHIYEMASFALAIACAITLAVVVSFIG